MRDLLDREARDPVSVVVLDTGVDLTREVPSALKQDRYKSYTWIGVPDDTETLHHDPRPGRGDPDGHGTHMALIFLSTAGTCMLYVVQVAGARSEIHGEEANDLVAANIARAGLISCKNLMVQLTQH